jgi:branched-chain amino acid transport system permease protein
MHEFLEFTIIGIVLGSAYAVAASGLVVTYATSGIFNIAHGAIGMFMAFVYWQLSVGWHMNTLLSFVLTVFVLAPLLGAVIERGVIQWMDPNNVATTLAVTVGLTLLLFGLVSNYIWKPTARVVPQFFGFGGFNFLGVHIEWEEAITVGAAIAIAVGLRLFLYQTRTGIAMRGVVDNRPLIGLFGGRPPRLSTLSWSIGASLASVAGILVAPRLQLQPLILTLLVIDAYAAAVIGRLRSLPMTFFGALIIGLASAYIQGYIPTTGSFWSSTPVQGLALSVPSIILFIALLAVPAHRIRSGAPQRHAPLAPAGLVRSLQGGVALVAAVAVAVSFMGPASVIKLGIGLAFALVCLSLVPLTGWGGYTSICQLTFAGLGAYAMFRFGHHGSVMGLVAAAALPGAVGAVVVLFVLRLRGLYLALATMAFATLMDNTIFPWSAVFGFDGSLAVPKPVLFGLNVNSPKAFTIFLAVVFALFSIGILALRRGPFGRVLVAAKDSEAACATLGQSVTTTKLMVFILSAAMAGVAGAFFGAASSVAGATNFEMFESLLILAVVAIGGVSVCSGALAGGLALGFLPANAESVFIGAGTVILAFYPDGVLPLAYSRLNRWWATISPPREAPAPIGAGSGGGAGRLAGSRAA